MNTEYRYDIPCDEIKRLFDEYQQCPHCKKLFKINGLLTTNSSRTTHIKIKNITKGIVIKPL
jgi:hypothetical protein